jgi:hypothetical protein
MTVRIPADVERLLVTWALEVDDITDIFGDRIYTEVPGRDPEWPLLRFQRITGGPVDARGFLDSPLVQIDVWGGPKATARLGIETVRAHIGQSLPGYTDDDATVTATSLGSLGWLPDDDFEPPRPRYSADVRIWLHAT